MVILNILLLILILGILILIHEFGHFLFAKLCKVHIYEFSIGMGPAIKTIKGKDKVDYSIRALPIGGYVSMAGEVNEDDGRVRKDHFMCNKPWYQKIVILAAGVTFNFILALILLFAIGMIWGSPNHEPIIGKIMDNTPIARTETEVGDRITHINGSKIGSIDEAQIRFMLKEKDKAYDITIEKPNGQTEEIVLKKATIETEEGEEYEGFGFNFQSEKETGFIASIKYAFAKFVITIETMCITIGHLFTTKLSLSNLSGPVGMYTAVEQSVSLGMVNVVYLTALLSINLGFLNILPIPAFDGGRILFLIIEKIIGSPINPKVENIIHTIFFGLLMLLMIYITLSDIFKLF